MATKNGTMWKILLPIAGALLTVGGLCATINTDNISAALSVAPFGPIFNATPPELIEYVAGELIVLDVATAANAVTATCYLFGFLDDA